MITDSAGIQNHGCAYHGNAARRAGVAFHHFHAPTPPTPNNGEIATPVMVEMACAASTPGVAGAFDEAAGADTRD